VWYPCLKTCHASIEGVCIKTCTSELPYPCVKTTLVDGWCYDFSSSAATCYGIYEVHYGCCGGVEYKWVDWCLGAGASESGVSPVGPGEFGGGYKCLEDKAERLGKCREGYSIPQGGELPGGPVDGGSVDPQPGLRGRNVLRRTSGGLGTCTRCVGASAMLAAIAGALWIAAGQSGTDILEALALAIVVATLGLFIAHILAFSVRRAIGVMKRHAYDCPCNAHKREATL
jgi:hypothetical protein